MKVLLAAMAFTTLSAAAVAADYTLNVVNRTEDTAIVTIFQRPQGTVSPAEAAWIKLGQQQQTIQVWQSEYAAEPLCTLDVKAGETIYVNGAPSGIVAFFNLGDAPCTTQ